MNIRKAISILLVAVLGVVSVASVAAAQGHGADRMRQVDRDRTFERDRGQDRDRGLDRDRQAMRGEPRDWDRLNIRDALSLKDQDIYGHEYMSADECNKYREQLRRFDSPEELREFQAQHEDLMQKRALVKGGDLVPPGQGPVYGRELMSVQERNRFRERLRRLDTDQERRNFIARHRARMNKRARALGYTISETE